MPSIVQAPPMQFMSTMDEADKVVCGLQTGGSIVAAAGCVCLGLGAFKGIVPLIVGGSIVAAAGGAVVMFSCDKND